MEVNKNLIERFENCIGEPVHYLIKRGLFNFQNNLENFVDKCEKKEQVNIYMKFGDPSQNLKLNHLRSKPN